jgi:hypothetical protein
MGKLKIIKIAILAILSLVMAIKSVVYFIEHICKLKKEPATSTA